MKCQKCKETIHTLVNIVSGTAAYVLDKDGEYEHHDEFFEPDGKSSYWACPSCLEALFTSEQDAVDALNIEDIIENANK